MMSNNDKTHWENVKKIYLNTDCLTIGKYYSHMILKDAKHLLFTLSRYKFASKLLMYKKNISILELGCQEGLGALLFNQNTDLCSYTGIDLDSNSIKWNKINILGSKFHFVEGNFFNYKFNNHYDAIVSLDVIEHIEPNLENDFLKIIVDNLTTDGGCVAIIGTPNISMGPYASEGSKIAHINLYNQQRLYEVCNKFFKNVFIFNMNDEIVNTSFPQMSCYIFAVCTEVRYL